MIQGSFFFNSISRFTSGFAQVFMYKWSFHQGGHNSFAINSSCWSTSYTFEMIFSNFKYQYDIIINFPCPTWISYFNMLITAQKNEVFH